jgi:hypothetical protein
MLAMFYYLFTMTRMVETTFKITFSIVYTNMKLCGAIEACFGIF